MPKSDDRPPVQHTPVHLREENEVFDRRHPAASSFAPLQPALGVVANDVEERGQNLNGGPKADDAQKDNLDQTEKLAEQHRESLQAAASPAPAVKVEGDQATPVKSSSPAKTGAK